MTLSDHSPRPSPALRAWLLHRHSALIFPKHELATGHPLSHGGPLPPQAHSAPPRYITATDAWGSSLLLPSLSSPSHTALLMESLRSHGWHVHTVSGPPVWAAPGPAYLPVYLNADPCGSVSPISSSLDHNCPGSTPTNRTIQDPSPCLPANHIPPPVSGAPPWSAQHFSAQESCNTHCINPFHSHDSALCVPHGLDTLEDSK